MPTPASGAAPARLNPGGSAALPREGTRGAVPGVRPTCLAHGALPQHDEAQGPARAEADGAAQGPREAHAGAGGWGPWLRRSPRSAGRCSAGSAPRAQPAGWGRRARLMPPPSPSSSSSWSRRRRCPGSRERGSSGTRGLPAGQRLPTGPSAAAAGPERGSPNAGQEGRSGAAPPRSGKRGQGAASPPDPCGEAQPHLRPLLCARQVNKDSAN